MSSDICWVLFSPSEGNFNRLRIFKWLLRWPLRAKGAIETVFDLNVGRELDAIIIGYDKEENLHDIVVISRGNPPRHTVKGVEQPLPDRDFRFDFDFDYGKSVAMQLLSGFWAGEVVYMRFVWKKDGEVVSRDHLSVRDVEE